MSSIEIEYCGAWGYGGPATKLKDRLAKDLGIPVNAHSASGTTGVIEVTVCKGGAKEVVWKKGKPETIAGHDEIVGLAKKALWLNVDRWNKSSPNEENFWNLGSSLKKWWFVPHTPLKHYFYSSSFTVSTSTQVYHKKSIQKKLTKSQKLKHWLLASLEKSTLKCIQEVKYR